MNYLLVNSNGGHKDDTGKLRFDLVPAKALEAVADIFSYGSVKYADRNWEKGLDYGRCYAAAMRHLWAFWRGEAIDPESGKPHLAHAMVNLFFLLHFEQHRSTYQQFDNRAIDRKVEQSAELTEPVQSNQINYVTCAAPGCENSLEPGQIACSDICKRKLYTAMMRLLGYQPLASEDPSASLQTTAETSTVQDATYLQIDSTGQSAPDLFEPSTEKSCKLCTKPFVPTTPNQKYCLDPCDGRKFAEKQAEEKRLAKQAAKAKARHKCAYPDCSNLTENKYCSSSCSGKMGGRQRLENYAVKKQHYQNQNKSSKVQVAEVAAVVDGPTVPLRSKSMLKESFRD